MKMKESQFLLIKEQLKKLTAKECFYKHKLEGVNVNQIQSQEDFEKLPFTWKGDLREAYPLGLMAAPEEKIVRIHSSSGTTGTPVIIPYTQKDVAHRTVDFISIIMRSCLSVLPGPMGTVIAPRRSAPSWKPIPAVHRPYPGVIWIRSRFVMPAIS